VIVDSIRYAFCVNLIFCLPEKSSCAECLSRFGVFLATYAIVCYAVSAPPLARGGGFFMKGAKRDL